MIDTLGYDTFLPIHLGNPINRRHPLNAGRQAWWLTLTGLDGGKFFYDLMDLWTGTLTSMGTGSGWQGTPRKGGFGQLKFDGTSSYVATTGLFSYAQMTWKAWVRPDDFSLSNAINRRIVHSSDNSGNNETNLVLGSTNSNVTWYTFTSSSQFSVTSAPSSLAIGNWYHICGTRDGSNAFLYINGKQAATGADAGGVAVPTSASFFTIGKVQFFGGGFLSGALDDVSVWNRALSATEVKADYDLSLLLYPDVLNRVESHELNAPNVFTFQDLSVSMQPRRDTPVPIPY